MDKSLREASTKLTMAAHTAIIEIIVHNCYYLVHHNYERISCNYPMKSPWDITIDEFNSVTMDAAINGSGGDDAVYIFPDDKSLESFGCMGRSTNSFEYGYAYYVTPTLIRKVSEDSKEYNIEDVILTRMPIGPNLQQMIDESVLRIIVSYIDPADKYNGLTTNMLACATNIMRQFSIYIDFYTRILLPDKIGQKDVRIEDAMALSAWVDKLYQDLQKIPVGLIKFKNGNVYNAYIGVGGVSNVEQYGSHNRIHLSGQLPALYVRG